MIRLIAISLLVVLASCRSHKEVVKQTTTSQSSLDSIVYIDRVKLDTIRIPSETLEIIVPVEVLKTDTVIMYKNGRASTKVVYRDGILHLDTRCDSLERLVLSTEKILIHQKERNKELEQLSITKEVIVKPVRWYYKAALWIVIALGGLWLVKTAIKKGLNPALWFK